jgi:hypothetical protein
VIIAKKNMTNAPDTGCFKTIGTHRQSVRHAFHQAALILVSCTFHSASYGRKPAHEI